jgi:transposase
VCERLVSQRTGIINQIRAFLLERGVAVRQGLRFLRSELPGILAQPSDALSPRMVRIIEDLAGDWRRLDERIEGLSNEIEAIAYQDAGCERLISVPGIGPIISSAIVAAIGAGDVFSKGRDFAAWLGLVPRQISTGDRTILGKISKRGNRYLRVLFVQAAWVSLPSALPLAQKIARSRKPARRTSLSSRRRSSMSSRAREGCNSIQRRTCAAPCSAFLSSPKDELIAYAQTNDGWSSVMYSNPKTGNSVSGWVRSERLRETGAVGPKQ